MLRYGIEMNLGKILGVTRGVKVLTVWQTRCNIH